MRRVILMRHSVRLDDDPSLAWSDSATRPHDPPITDYDLPRAVVKRYDNEMTHDLYLSSLIYFLFFQCFVC
jgi:hypothetical protein